MEGRGEGKGKRKGKWEGEFILPYHKILDPPLNFSVVVSQWRIFIYCKRSIASI